MYLLLLIFVLTFLFYLFLLKPQKYWKNRNVPCDPSIPLLGHMAKQTFKIEHFTETMQKMYDKYSKFRFFGIYNFISPILVIRDPELIKIITVKDFDAFSSHKARADEDVDPLWSKNLFAIENPYKWRKMRATLSPTFTTSKLRQMYELMQDCAKNFTDYFRNCEEDVIEVNLKDSFRRYATDVIASAAFGITTDSLKDRNNKFYEMGTDIANFSGIRALKLFIYSISPLLVKTLRIGIIGKQPSSFFRKIVKENIRSREEQGIVRPDMIHLLLEARKGKLKRENPETNNKESSGFAEVNESDLIEKESASFSEITDDDITAQAIAFFLGGFDTTSSAMSSAIAELAANTEIQQRLYEEIIKVYKSSEGNPQYSDIQQMKYLDMVLSETLRKWGQGIFLDRQAEKSYTIVGKNGEPDVILNKGDVVWIPAYQIHRDPKYYPNPEKFDPERFSEERKHEIKPFTYMPFGVGPRNCIGSRFALLESKIIIFYIILNFEVSPTKRIKLPLRLDKSQLIPSIDGGFLFEFRKRQLPIITE